MPRNALECLKLRKGRGNLVILVLKVHYNDENVMHHLLMGAV